MGNGNAAAAALAAGPAEVLASDPEPRMIALGRQRLGDAVTWVQAGAERSAPPPAAGAPSLLDWGDAGYLRERLEDHGLDVEVAREPLPFEAGSLDAWIDHQERHSTPWSGARQREGAAWPELREEIRALLAASNEDEGGFRVTSRYLLAVGRG